MRVRTAAFLSVLAVVLTGVCIPRFIRFEHSSSPWLVFGAAGLGGLAIVGASCRWDLAAVGLVLRPRQGAWFWLKMALIIGTAIGIACAIVVVAATMGHDAFLLCRREVLAPTAARLVALCLLAPVTEELLWRVVLCTAAARLMGSWPAIALTGTLFAAAHWMYGVSGPDNLLAGFALAWAFLKSGTFVVPLALHACGNAVAIALQSSTVVKELACGLP